MRISKVIKKEIDKFKNVDESYWKKEKSQGLTLVDIVKAIFPPDNYRQIIDVGCGAGHLLFKLVEFDYVGCGVDPAKETIPRYYNQYENIVFEGIASNIPFSDKCCDLVLCTDVLEHIPEKYIEKSLCELERIARRGIFISISQNNSLTLKGIDWWIEKIKNNISGKLNSFFIGSTLIFKIELQTLISPVSNFISLQTLAENLQGYESGEDFYNYRDIITIQHYKPLKNLGYKNFLKCEEKFKKILLIGAGPGFSKNIQKIKEFKEKGYSLWACNHVAEGLLQNDIEVNYMFGAESREVLMKTLHTPRSKKHIYENIVLHAACHPKGFLEMKAKKRWMYFSSDPNNEVINTFYKLNNEIPIPSQASVSGFMLEFAYYFNPEEIILIGYDFINENNQAYDKSVKYLNTTKLGKVIFDAKKPIKATTDGKNYMTTETYKKYAALTSIIIAQNKILRPNVKLKRISDSPLKFGRKDDAFLKDFKKKTGLDYYKLLEKYSLVDIFKLETIKEKDILPLDFWRFSMIPDKILNTKLPKDRKKIELLKKLVYQVYNEDINFFNLGESCG